MEEKFYSWKENDLILNVLVKAGAKNDSIGKIFGNRLKISIKEIPENGKATEYMIKFLAKVFGVCEKNIELIYGKTNKLKCFKIKSPKKIPKEISLENFNF